MVKLLAIGRELLPGGGEDRKEGVNEKNEMKVVKEEKQKTFILFLLLRLAWIEAINGQKAKQTNKRDDSEEYVSFLCSQQHPTHCRNHTLTHTHSLSCL
jgi:hypothetical protein